MLSWVPTEVSFKSLLDYITIVAFCDKRNPIKLPVPHSTSRVNHLSPILPQFTNKLRNLLKSLKLRLKTNGNTLGTFGGPLTRAASGPDLLRCLYLEVFTRRAAQPAQMGSGQTQKKATISNVLSDFASWFSALGLPSLLFDLQRHVCHVWPCWCLAEEFLPGFLRTPCLASLGHVEILKGSMDRSKMQTAAKS